MLFLAKVILKLSLINSLILIGCCGSMSYCVEVRHGERWSDFECFNPYPANVENRVNS